MITAEEGIAAENDILPVDPAFVVTPTVSILERILQFDVPTVGA